MLVTRAFGVAEFQIEGGPNWIEVDKGLVTPRGRETFARRWSQILGAASEQLSPRLLVLIQRLREHWVALDGQIAEATQELTAWADASPLCQRVATVPGVGPMIATALVSAVGDARMFARGRDMAAWLGLVPRQHSTRGTPTLGRISRRGNGIFDSSSYRTPSPRTSG